MFNFARTAALSLTVLLGSFSGMTIAAQADTVRVTIAPETVQYRHDRRDRDWRRPAPRHERHARRACTPDRAVSKARRMGINRARVVNVNRRTISVRGFQRGHSVRIAFARAPNCPILR